MQMLVGTQQHLICAFKKDKSDRMRRKKGMERIEFNWRGHETRDMTCTSNTFVIADSDIVPVSVFGTHHYTHTSVSCICTIGPQCFHEAPLNCGGTSLYRFVKLQYREPTRSIHSCPIFCTQIGPEDHVYK